MTKPRDESGDAVPNSAVPQDESVALQANASGTSTPGTYPTSYPWYVRWFIIIAVFFIVSRSAFNVRMHKVDWATELSMYTLPYTLPSSKERREIQAGESKRYRTLSKRFEASWDSFLRFANPIPQEKTRKKIESNIDWLKYATVWVHSRAEFLGRLVGVDERWTMYSPTVGKVRTVVRAVLRYEDGSTMEARARTEPRDLASYFRPFAQRRLQFDINLPSMEGVRLGWARYLARNHAKNHEGSPLKSIDMYKVSYKLPDPGSDYAKHWRSGNGRRVKGDPFWRFDVARNTGQSLEKKKDNKKAGASAAKPQAPKSQTPMQGATPPPAAVVPGTVVPGTVVPGTVVPGTVVPEPTALPLSTAQHKAPRAPTLQPADSTGASVLTEPAK